jgi:hypothetical protein
MGDVGGAECDLGGGVVEGGSSTITVGSGDGSGRDGVASDESILEGVNPSSRLSGSDGRDVCAES